ncbi:MAG: CHAD domain-containing protein, partial [Hyphococcus sp.]
ERLASLQPALVDFRQVEGVHQMRVALRRLRSVERVCRRAHRAAGLSGLSQRARVFARRLGPARDWDVFLEETLPATLESGYAPPAARAFYGAAHDRRAQAWDAAVEAVNDPGFTLFLIDLLEAAVLARWRQGADGALAAPVREFAPRALDRTLKKTLRTAGAINLNCLEELHDLRIALKKLRYPVQMFRPIYPKAARKDYMAALAGLQEAFGKVNDAVVAQRLAGEASAGGGADVMRAAGFVSGYKAAEAAAAAEVIAVDWPVFAAMTPFWRA